MTFAKSQQANRLSLLVILVVGVVVGVGVGLVGLEKQSRLEDAARKSDNYAATY